MVRSIRSCVGCLRRFVAHADAVTCSQCPSSSASAAAAEASASSSSESHRKAQSPPSVLLEDTTTTKESVISLLGDDDDDDDEIEDRKRDHVQDQPRDTDWDEEDGCSEGGDDFHCTQIVVDNDDDGGGDDELEAAADRGETPAHKGDSAALSEQTSRRPDAGGDPPSGVDAPPASQSRSGPRNVNNSPADICFICGTSLAGLKRRIDHIKRCSKRHNITGRDVLVGATGGPMPPGAARAATSPGAGDDACGGGNNNNNPYRRRESDWHGDAPLALLEAAAAGAARKGPHAEQRAAAPAAATTTTRQTSLTDGFLLMPVRDVNRVLMSGSRRSSGETDTAAAAAAANTHDSKKGTGGGGWKNRRQRGWSSNGAKDYSKYECPMYKKIPRTDFVVDGFLYAKPSLTRNYFLTHFHSDHYGGINSSWQAGTIYCSLPTANLVNQQLGVDRRYLHPLPMMTPTAVESRGRPITVTLLDANHCPGAVMFLFEGGNGRTVLHVGDFRWSREAMLQPESPLHKITTERSLDELFLDTTYCDPTKELPTQEEAIEAVIAIFEREMLRRRGTPSKRTLHLFGAYTIGKERMYLSVAERFGLKVYVDSSRYRILSTLNWPKERMDLLTKNREESCIWVVPLGHINMKKMPDYLATANSKPFAPQYDFVYGYRPTGWSLSSKPSAGLVSTRSSGNLAIHGVPYSEHSSFPELVDCLACLRPAKIIPTVSASKSDEQVAILLNGLQRKQTKLCFSAESEEDM